jgi:hypothetical protein
MEKKEEVQKTQHMGEHRCGIETVEDEGTHPERTSKVASHLIHLCCFLPALLLTLIPLSMPIRKKRRDAAASNGNHVGSNTIPPKSGGKGKTPPC